MMKALLFILLVVFIPFAACADPGTPEELAKSYIAAVQALDGPAIRKLVHPLFLEKLDANQKALVELWIKQSITDAGKWHGPLNIKTTAMTPASLTELGKHMIVLMAPEVQIQMETDRDGLSVQWAALYKGKYYFIFPFPKDQ